VSDSQLQHSNAEMSTAFKTQKSVSTITDTSLVSMSAKVLPRKPSMMDFATPTAMVSAFCRAVLSTLIPHEFWGAGEVRIHNENAFHRKVDQFIGLRRFESLSLHEVSQGIKARANLDCC
jgi:telomerase reverse transcriptase